MFSKLKEEIVSKFEEKLEQQMNQIDKFEEKLEKQANRINKLEGKIALQKKMSESNVTTMNNTADVLVFEFMELKYRSMNRLMM